MEFKIEDDELQQIQYHLTVFRQMDAEIQKLAQQRNRAFRDANTAWKSVYRGVQLNDPELAKEQIPDLIDENGQFCINIDKDGNATWEDNKEDDEQTGEKTNV